MLAKGPSHGYRLRTRLGPSALGAAWQGDERRRDPRHLGPPGEGGTVASERSAGLTSRERTGNGGFAPREPATPETAIAISRSSEATAIRWA
jgi:hypothetical protein